MSKNKNVFSDAREKRLWELTRKYVKGEIKEGDQEYKEYKDMETEDAEAFGKAMMAMSKSEVNRKIKRAFTYPFRKIYHLIKK